MSLTPGTRLGVYEITAQIGEGGMGQVYRATDTKLKRQVAIKILPPALAADADRLARFQREAELLASLNHPNIAAIYGLEESAGMTALVLEIVEGDDLSQRVAKGAVPIDEALPIAKQIAEALEAAHDQGIIHRDLKPANIKIRADGTVKVLDFGLGKAMEPASGASSPNLSMSPTITTPAMTKAGMILGTAAYMSPEQARGKAVDRRADIWAFGVVLFEMVTGTRAFEGELITDVLASVLKTDPDWSALPAGMPIALGQLLRRCLEKDPRRRLQAIGEARVQTENLLRGVPEEAAITSSSASSPASPPTSATGPATRPSLITRAFPWAGMAVATLAVVAILMMWAPWRKTTPPAPVRVVAELGADVKLITDLGASTILSPDGTVMAFVARPPAALESRLYVRRLDQLEATPLAGTEGAESPFFSPDGQWIGYFTPASSGKLMKVSVTGGAPIALCDAPSGRGGSWGADGTIVFTPKSGAGVGLQRVSSAGGRPESLIPLQEGETTQRWPQLLPDGAAVLFTSNDRTGAPALAGAALVAQRLPAGERKVLQRDAVYGRYLPSGHLIYLHNATLFAAPFDVNTLELTGPAVPVVDGVFAGASAASAQFSTSDTGTFVYVAGGQNDSATVPISWVDRSGKTTVLRATPANWTDIRFSPDGRRIAMDIYDGKQRDIWTYDWVRDTLSRLTFDQTDDASPVWTPDGSRIAFASKRGGGVFYNIYWQRADGTGDVQRLTQSATSHQIPESWDPTGRLLAFHDIPQTGAGDIEILPIGGSEASGWKSGTPTVFLDSPATELNPMLSPDGRWLAYESNESGQFEIYVRPYPGPGGKWQISTAGGTYATWSRTKRELFFGTPDQHLMVAPYAVEGDSFRAEKPTQWSDTRFTPGQYRRYDLHPDGTRFAVSKDPTGASESTGDKVVFVFNFLDYLRKIAPATK